MIERQTDIVTRDGATTTFIVHPERGGPHPVILFFMDAPAIREELRDMARRLASCGYYVLLPNLYYRSGVMEIGPIPPDPDHPARKQMFQFMDSLNIDLVMSDAEGLLAFAGADPAADVSRVGAVGYCMSGRYAISLAARYPERVFAAASVYGTHLVTEAEDSPHRTSRLARAELYFACAEEDVWAPPETIAALSDALKADRVDAEVEVYPGTKHGFAFPQRPVYDRTAAERHWERLNSLFRRKLG
ncbi:MAG: dienelactone hydrolase family protein [Phenylobacterium sp.]|uniref:dienelactone hydrolase family protein n=1 Tax=Phenylobacterium sp. TaxID=1871053 RepID=UPI0025FC5780|nr:dienelactone hydrolase family protein [Phenylobacterium sp.]MCA6225775.1 dienelactone hydrolase family protein [Phenylobacterium sp.]MCA6230662.1 dienelactone hydrolase family protein [Phenylobacterium sp.]MCA6235202.1 dienelactone hydrolase family protein [Phenylobacterium sp.]MCA6248016.1 dienelactone hydrolase family protein [Phenylobacterium sp.]MCA6250705.1 dienelactone hydrolase family protein [Phenylobacterium sp.]